jgi:hypothetical protein
MEGATAMNTILRERPPGAFPVQIEIVRCGITGGVRCKIADREYLFEPRIAVETARQLMEAAGVSVKFDFPDMN